MNLGFQTLNATFFILVQLCKSITLVDSSIANVKTKIQNMPMNLYMAQFLECKIMWTML